MDTTSFAICSSRNKETMTNPFYFTSELKSIDIAHIDGVNVKSNSLKKEKQKMQK